MNENCLTRDEKAIFALRTLYRKHGYQPYEMSKFEEYDLYLKNKDFLMSDRIITFTDTDGKLMALKPDVTLSIVKNRKSSPEKVRKVYYDEKVYRVSGGSFKEITQAGLECIGDVDDYTVYEVLSLAADSLGAISEDYVLEVSHLGVLSRIIERMGIPDDVQRKVVKCIGEKNVHGIKELAAEAGFDPSALCAAVSAYGSLADVLPTLDKLGCDDETGSIRKIFTALEKNGYCGKVRFDFSVVSDMNYYNGFIFKGFINGIPDGVLSGGQYDGLITKLDGKERAIGFAVYLDMLERLPDENEKYDVDVVLLYDSGADIEKVNDTIKLFSSGGSSVVAQTVRPEKLRYRQLVRLTERGVEILENKDNA